MDHFSRENLIFGEREKALERERVPQSIIPQFLLKILEELTREAH